MDVWFDSGSSWAGVAKAREALSYPADLYLEGDIVTAFLPGAGEGLRAIYIYKYRRHFFRGGRSVGQDRKALSYPADLCLGR